MAEHVPDSGHRYMKAVGSAPQLPLMMGGMSDEEVFAHKNGLLADM